MQATRSAAQLSEAIAPSAAATNGELAERAANGDHAAFELIMRRHNRLLFRTARSILKVDADAQDALQEAYLRAWRGLRTWRADAQLSTWLVRIVINEALSRLRRLSATVVHLGSAADLADSHTEHTEHAMADEPDHRPESMAMRADVRRLLEARIDRLPESFRTVFMLRAVEELSVEEVAQALQLPAATVRTRYFRARSMLREGLSRDIDLATADAFSFAGARCDRVVADVLAQLAAQPDTRSTPPAD